MAATPPPRTARKRPRDSPGVAGKKRLSDDTEEDIEDLGGGTYYGDVYIPPPPPPAFELTHRNHVIISHIKNYNFKSYYGEVIIGPLNSHFNSVVGPNGSGKSNVIDSILFVFGYRASKIRSGKLSSLIHKSERATNLKSCTVEVYFKEIWVTESGDEEDIAGSAFVISRTAYADNSSTYAINGCKAVFRDVNEKLRTYGIDLRFNRFLVLQGEIEKISQMKPKGQAPNEIGMLEYIEDIVGTSRYQQPLATLEGKLGSIDEDYKMKHKRLNNAKESIQAIQNPMEEAVQFLKQENVLKIMQNQYFQAKICQIRKNSQEELEAIQRVQEEIANLEDEIATLIANQNEFSKSLKELKKKLDTVQKNVAEITDRRDKAAKKCRDLTNNISAMEESLKKKITELGKEEAKVKSLLKVPENNSKRIKELESEIPVLQEKHEYLSEELRKIEESVQGEAKIYQERLKELDAKQEALDSAHLDKTQKYNAEKSKYNMYVMQRDKDKKLLTELTEQLKHVDEELNKLQREKEKLATELTSKEEEQKATEAELVENRKRESILKKIVNDQYEIVREQKNRAASNSVVDDAVKYLRRLESEGRALGVLGRLGDLGVVDPKYDVAVSTACWNLNYIIVDTTQNVNECVKVLKGKSTGRTSFQALNKIGACREKPAKTPENVPRLFDLIRPVNDTVKPAFYSGLGETLLADNLDQAARIAYGKVRHRVVTLKGEIIEPSGTMTGGGDKVIKGLIRTSLLEPSRLVPISGENMKKHEETYNKMNEQLIQVTQRLRDLEQKNHSLQPELTGIKTRRNEVVIEITDLVNQKNGLTKHVEKQRKLAAATAAVKTKDISEALHASMMAAEKELKDAEHAAMENRAKREQISDQLAELTSGRIKTALNKVQEVTVGLEKCKDDINRLKAEIGRSERNLERAQDSVNCRKMEIPKIEEQITKLKNEKVQAEDEVQVMEDELGNVQVQYNEQLSEMKEAEKKSEKLSKSISSKKQHKLEKQHALEDIQTKLKKKTAEIPSFQNKIKGLKLNKIPSCYEATRESSVLELRPYTEEELEGFDLGDLERRIRSTQDFLNRQTPDLQIIEAYEIKKKQLDERESEFHEVSDQRDQYKEWVKQLTEQRRNEFRTAFAIIRNELKCVYQCLTMGGDADLEFVDSQDPFYDGILFNARPKNKTWKNIGALSGGEKTLCSLSLIFSLHYYRPTPFYVMDEIDAALDTNNVQIVARYLKDRTSAVQFIVISLRSQMYEVANSLIGIYKVHNCTGAVGIEREKDEDGESKFVQNRVFEAMEKGQ